MTPFDYLTKIKALNKKIEMLVFSEKPILKPMELEINKLICDYNESIKNKGNGK